MKRYTVWTNSNESPDVVRAHGTGVNASGVLIFLDAEGELVRAYASGCWMEVKLDD